MTKISLSVVFFGILTGFGANSAITLVHAQAKPEGKVVKQEPEHRQSPKDSLHEQREQGLSLSDIIKTGLKRSPKIKQIQADLAAAQAVTQTNKSRLFPEVSLKASASAQDASASTRAASSSSSTSLYSEDYQAYLNVTQPLFTGGLATGAIAASREEESIQQLTLSQTKQKVIKDLASAYYTVSEKTRLLQAAEENIEILKSYADVIRRYEKIGRARKTDLLQAQINLTSARARSNEIQSQLFEEKEKLRELLALENVPAIQVDREARLIKVEKLDSQVAVQMAFAANPEILIAEKKKEKVLSEKKMALAEDWPSLSLSGKIGYQSPDQPTWMESRSEFSSIALELKVPIFSGLSSMAKRRNFEQKKVSATRELELTKFSTESSLTSKLHELEASLERLQIARQAAMDARQALVLANKDYQRSLISSQDVISIQRTRYEAEQLFINTQYTYLKTLLQARELMGIDLEKAYVEN